MKDPAPVIRHQRPPLTQDDLDLLALTTEEIRNRTEVHSFDLEAFKSETSNGAPGQQLLRAHLYYDHVLTEILRDALKHPDVISLKKMSFEKKLDLSHAMGLIPDELVSNVRWINKNRNKIAHDLKFELSNKHHMDLKNCTPVYLRNIMETDKDRELGPLRFYELLFITLLKIEILRQSHAYSRLMNKKGEIRLRTVLEGTRNVTYRE